MTWVPPGYRPLNPIAAFIEAKQEIVTLDTDVSDLTDTVAALEADVAALEADVAAYEEELAAPTLHFAGPSAIFGDIAVATTHTLEISYSGGISGTVVSAIASYSGDSGAFQVTGNPDPLSSPYSMSNGSFFTFPILPQSYGYALGLPIKALAADAGVTKTGTLTLYDKITGTAPAPPVGVRLIGTINLSKKYVP